MLEFTLDINSLKELQLFLKNISSARLFMAHAMSGSGKQLVSLEDESLRRYMIIIMLDSI